MKNKLLKKLHPVAFLLFFAQALILCFFSDVAGVAVITLCVFVYSVLEKKAKTALWTLPLALFIMLLNPIFNHSGVTVLFVIDGYNFTLEAILNGVYSALLIVSTVLIFSVLGSALGEEKFLYVFGRVLPKTALMVSMIFRHMDMLNRAYKQTRENAVMNGCYENDKKILGKIKSGAVVLTAFTGTALEGSIDTGLSLISKGYYSKNKTRLRKYRLHFYDVLFIIVTLCLCTAVFLAPGYFKLIPTALFFGCAFIPGGKDND